MKIAGKKVTAWIIAGALVLASFFVFIITLVIMRMKGEKPQTITVEAALEAENKALQKQREAEREAYQKEVLQHEKTITILMRMVQSDKDSLKMFYEKKDQQNEQKINEIGRYNNSQLYDYFRKRYGANN